MKVLLGVAFGGCVIAAAATAQAATPVAQLTDMSGKVMVSSENGFEPASSAANLGVGSKVFVGSKSSATLFYPSANCSVNISEGSVVTVKSKAPCAAGEKVGAADSSFVQPAADMDVPGAAGMGAPAAAAPGIDPAVWPIVAIGGGGLAAVGICAAAGCFDSDGNNHHGRPASP